MKALPIGGTIMNKKMSLLYIAAITTLMLTALPCLAGEYKGEIVRMTDTRLEIKVKGEGSQSFEVTKSTRVFMNGLPFQVHRLLPHTKARVVANDNKVDAIFVEGVPK